MPWCCRCMRCPCNTPTLSPWPDLIGTVTPNSSPSSPLCEHLVLAHVMEERVGDLVTVPWQQAVAADDQSILSPYLPTSSRVTCRARVGARGVIERRDDIQAVDVRVPENDDGR